MTTMQRLWRYRFPVILVGSIVLHLSLVLVLIGSYMFGMFSSFGSLVFDTESGENLYKIADVKVDRTKPLYLPEGFYAVEDAPTEEELRRRAEEERLRREAERRARQEAERKRLEEERKREEAERKRLEEEARQQEEAAKDEGDGTKDEEGKKPNDGTFGTIRTRAFHPHIKQAYEAYLNGLIDVENFTVTVACKAEPDGSLSDIRIIKSSGDRLIDATALKLFQELSAMKALAPLAQLQQLSMTLEKGPSSSSLMAEGYTDSATESAAFAQQLNLLKSLARFKMKNDDQMLLYNNVDIDSTSNRVQVRLALPNSKAGDIMYRSFGPREAAQTEAR